MALNFHENRVRFALERKPKTISSSIAVLGALACLLGLVMAILVLCPGCAYSQEQQYSDVQLANAIFKAENSKTHPYGILATYKHTTPRQACLNTIAHKRRDWIKAGSHGDFITYLASKYCPIGAGNDPTGLNVNWERNVKYWLVRNG